LFFPSTFPTASSGKPKACHATGTPYPIPPAPADSGDRWAAEDRSVALLVPSVVLPVERNLWINPMHPDYPKIAALAPERFRFDRRLLR